MDIGVVNRSAIPRGGEPVDVTFRFARGRGTIKGFDGLIQAAIVILLTNVNTSAARPSAGGNLSQDVYDIGLSARNTDRLAATLQSDILKVQDDMISDQGQYALPAQARLAGMTLREIVPQSDENTGSRISINIRITNAAGESADILI